MSKMRIGVTLEGGLVQSIFSDQELDIEVVTIDYDTEGTEDWELTDIEQEDGSTEQACVGVWPVEKMRIKQWPRP